MNIIPILISAFALVALALLLVPDGSTILSSLRAMSAQKKGLTMLANARTKFPSRRDLTAFAPSERVQPWQEGMKPGTIALANVARITESNYVEGTTAYITGWSEDDGLSETLDAIAPPVPVNRRFQYKGHAAGEVVLSEADDIRAVGADFKAVEYTGTDTQAATNNKGLTIVLDKDNMMGDDDINRAALRLMLRLKRNDLRRAYTALAALDAGTAKTWDPASPTDADGDVLSLIKSAGDAHGINPNVVVFDGAAMLQRKLVLRAVTVTGAFVSANMNLQELADFYQVDRVVLFNQRFRSSEGATPAEISSLKVFTMFSDSVPSTEDPSSLKRFWSGTDVGGEFAVYVVETAKTVEVTVEHYSLIVGVSGAGVKRYNVSAS